MGLKINIESFPGVIDDSVMLTPRLWEIRSKTSVRRSIQIFSTLRYFFSFLIPLSLFSVPLFLLFLMSFFLLCSICSSPFSFLTSASLCFLFFSFPYFHRHVCSSTLAARIRFPRSHNRICGAKIRPWSGFGKPNKLVFVISFTLYLSFVF